MVYGANATNTFVLYLRTMTEQVPNECWVDIFSASKSNIKEHGLI